MIEGFMKLTKHLAIAGLLFCSSLSASESSYIAPLASKSLLLDIITADANLVAVGERGHVLISSDNGMNWDQKNIPTTSTLTAVFHLGNKLWAVGHDSLIIGSQDSGESWQVQQFLPELQRPLLDVIFFDENHGVALGAYGVFFRTMDGGDSWEREYHPSFLHPDDQAYVEELKEEDEAFYREEMASILPHLNRITQAGERLIVAGESGLVAYSDDLGRSWQRVETGYYGSFFDVRQLANGEILAAGLRGNLYVSDVEMADWQHKKTGTTATINSIVTLGDSEALLVGNNGTLLWYGNGDVSLQRTEDGKSVLNAVANSNNITAVSAVGVKSLTRK